MKSLDDILFGFLIFFAIERTVRLFSNSVVEPWIGSKTPEHNTIESWKLMSEIAFLILACFVVYYFRKPLARIVR
jgi:hypothetical protein